MFSRVIERSVIISATPWTVWRVLVDFDNWPKWNPFMPSVEGTAEAGHAVLAQTRLWSDKLQPFALRVEQVDFCRQLVVAGSYRMPGLIDVIHCFIIAQLDSRTSRFTHGLRVSGLLMPLMGSRIERVAAKGMDTVNISLKAVAQGGQ
ncbi:SRPBCC domain-containing protein [Oleidesulfovibrio sp.]|uniref:SRPBCC domain-containing protein n=1 Tax=Oleidesulfovibrio sp. TaxID=2909707 RepID=UPI003A869A27